MFGWQFRSLKGLAMAIQSWISAGLIVGWLAGILLGRGYGMTGEILYGFIGALVGGSAALVLFVLSGAQNDSSLILAAIAFSAAVILIAAKRVLIHPRTEHRLGRSRGRVI
jgi:uncharacterized membrane protein YeaQ/YmgE (transglycosylase-associated protein family)